MLNRELLLIPDYNNINDSIELSKKWNAGFEYNDFFVPSLLDDAAKLRERIGFYKSLGRQENKDTLHGVFYDICVNSADSRIEEISKMRMYESMDIASELKCRAVIFHTNLIPGFETEAYLENWLIKNGEFYKKLLSEYPEMNIYVENMFDFKPDMITELGKYMKDCSNFGICFDVAHANLHEIPMGEWIKDLAPYIKHLHINDNNGRTDDHLALSEGSIEWQSVFNSLSEFNICADILVEVNGGEKFEKSMNYLRGLKNAL